MSTVVEKIEGILTEKYSADNYVALASEILDAMKLVAPNNPRKEFTNFSSHIESSTHVGNYSDPDGKKIIVMAVELKRETYVENSRSTQRSYAKKLIESGGADAALIAFYTPGDPRWRLSFVRLDYEMKIENGKLKTAENMTPARRYSFLVGKDEPCHTAIDRFRTYLENYSSAPTLDDLENAFSVEAVTKEFFDLYCEKFLQLRECLEKNQDFIEEAKLHNYTSAQFAKKLMGQIVFLYFLQKKGWLGVKAWPTILNTADYKKAYFSRGAKSRELIPTVYTQVSEDAYHINAAAIDRLSDDDETFLSTCVKGEPWGTGPHNFMRKLFELSEKRNANFFDDFLEPLFYDALNVNRGEQGYDPALHCRIPFLSGGLFEPIDGYEWKTNNFAIPNELFSNKKDHKDRLADGILDIFDRYNFTMSEDEPLEREVAIDPEMLGKVFENLLDVNDRKSKGAFYTPREIVHYMCQESLINYLTNTMHVSESAIRDFILYGDFMKDEDASVLKRAEKGDSYDLWVSEELYQLNNDGTIKLDRMVELDKALQDVCIADPAVGSGAFPLGMLNEIVRARQNITTYLDITQKIIDPKGAPREIRYRRINDRCARKLKYETIRNSIFAVDIEPSAVDIAQLRLWLALVIDDEITPNAVSALDGHINPLPLPNLECNILCGNSLLDEFEGTKLVNESDIVGTASDIMQTNIYQSSFDMNIERLIAKQDELFRCDDTNHKKIILQEIAALRDELIQSQIDGISDEQRERYEATKSMASKPFILWQLDFARVFKAKGGFDIVIGNPPYVNVEKMENRDLIFKNYNTCVGRTDLYIAFVELAARKLISAGGVFSFIIPYAYTNQNYGQPSRKMLIDEFNILEIVDTSDYLVFDTAMVKNVIIRVAKHENSKSTIISRVHSAADFASHIFERSTVDQELFNSVANQCFKTNGFQKLVSIKEKIEKEAVQLKDICLIAYGARINSKTDKNRTKDYYIHGQYESGYKPFIEGRNIQRYAHVQNGWLNYCPNEHYNPMFPELFENEKIIFIRVVSDRLRFSYDNEGLYNSHTVLNCTSISSLVNATHSSAKKAVREGNVQLSKMYSMKFLLALLNSSLMNWYFIQFISDGLNFYPDNAKQLPIIDIRSHNVNQNEVVELVDAILENKRSGKDTSDLEAQIDMIVFKMYGLDDEEIKTIERSDQSE